MRRPVVGLLLAAALLAAFLMLAGCAAGTVAGVPDKLADRLVAEADTPIARALRYNAIGIVVCELSVDQAVAEHARAPLAAAACKRLAVAMDRISKAAISPWFNVEMHHARQELYRAISDGLAVEISLGASAPLSLALLAARLPGGVVALSKLSALRADLVALTAPGDLIETPPTADQALGVRRVLAERLRYSLARLAALAAIP